MSLHDGSLEKKLYFSSHISKFYEIDAFVHVKEGADDEMQ